jgi:hypothetical protein
MDEQWNEQWKEWDAEEDEDTHLKPIPVHLYSVFEDGPFSLCSICQKPLITEDGGKIYEIKKIYKGKNVIFECAICHECGQDLLSEYSLESVEAIRGYFNENFIPGLSLLECHFCGKTRDPEVSSASVMAVCLGDCLVEQPVCMCDPCAELINDSLSKKTQDVNGDFLRDYFPGVPAEWQDSPIISL